MKRRIFYAHIYWSLVAGCPAHGLATPAIQFTFDCCLLADDLARLGGMAGFSPSAYRRRMSLQKETPALKMSFLSQGEGCLSKDETKQFLIKIAEDRQAGKMCLVAVQQQRGRPLHRPGLQWTKRGSASVFVPLPLGHSAFLALSSRAVFPY